MTEKNFNYEYYTNNKNRENNTVYDCDVMNDFKLMMIDVNTIHTECEANGISGDTELDHHTECEAMDISAGTELGYHTECEAGVISAGTELEYHTECEAGVNSAGTVKDLVFDENLVDDCHISAGTELEHHTECEAGIISAGTEIEYKIE